MVSATQTTLVQQHPGQATLLEQDGVYTVTDGDGEVQFTGGEIPAEFAYWQQVFGVPADDSEVAE